MLDANLNLLPPKWLASCIWAAMAGAGYLNNPELTAKPLLPTRLPPRRLNTQRIKPPYFTKPATGDNADGEVIYIGRADHQVKLRGYRIELTEIQQVLREYHAIDDAFVTVCGEGLQRHIVAYVTLPEPSSLAHSELDQQLLRLPAQSIT